MQLHHRENKTCSPWAVGVVWYRSPPREVHAVVLGLIFACLAVLHPIHRLEEADLIATGAHEGLRLARPFRALLAYLAHTRGGAGPITGSAGFVPDLARVGKGIPRTDCALPLGIRALYVLISAAGYTVTPLAYKRIPAHHLKIFSLAGVTRPQVVCARRLVVGTVSTYCVPIRHTLAIGCKVLVRGRAYLAGIAGETVSIRIGHA